MERSIEEKIYIPTANSFTSAGRRHVLLGSLVEIEKARYTEE